MKTTTDAVVVRHFNSRLVQLSIKYRGVVLLLWNNMIANNIKQVIKQYIQVKDNTGFLNFNFNSTSISTTDFNVSRCIF